MESPKGDVLLERLREYVKEQGKVPIHDYALQPSACKKELNFIHWACQTALVHHRCPVVLSLPVWIKRVNTQSSCLQPTCNM